MDIGMYFTKAALHQDGTMHWAATVSDTDVDNHDERVDRAFFDNALSHADEMDMMPYACISHYDFAGKGVPDQDWIAGPSTVMFPDGKKFKAKGTFWPTDLGKAAFAAIQNDIKKDVPHDERVRISMGFYDRTSEEEKSEATEDGSSRRVYRDGIIKHFALTRVPVLPRTEIEAWREKSMVTKRDDAASIIGDEWADKLEQHSTQVGKSDVDEEPVVVKAEEVEKAKRKKVDKDFEYEEEEPGKDTMAEEMWTETPEEAEVPEEDQAAKQASEEELKKRKKKKSEAVEKAHGEGQGVGGPKQGDGGATECICPECDATAPHDKGTPCSEMTCPECGAAMSGSSEKAELVEQMIREEGNKVVLYSKDGKKKLGEWEYGPGKEYKDKDAARAAAHKQEGIVQAIKEGKFKGGKKSEAEEMPETVEKAGRRLQGKKVEEFETWLTEMRRIINDGESFLEWAKQSAAPIGETTGIDMPIENPAISILEGTPQTGMVMASNFDSKLSMFAEDVYNAITEKDGKVAQDALYNIAEAIKSEISSEEVESVLEVVSDEDVKTEEVKRSSALDGFNMVVKSVIADESLDRRAKLMACQNALQEVGEFIQNSIISETPPSMGDIREVIVAAVHEGTKELVQKNVVLEAELAELKKQLSTQPAVEYAPVRKSLARSEAPAQKPKEHYSAAEVARKTMSNMGLLY